MKRNVIVLILSWFYVLCAGASTGKYRLSHWDDPATTVVIGWNQIDGDNPMVYYGSVDHGGNWESYPLAAEPTRSVDFAGMNNHFVRLSGLQPNTAYYFVIKDSNSASDRYWFKTAPDDPNTKLSIIAGGDSRNNRGPRINGNILVSKLKPHVVFFGGDMTQSCTDEQWNRWMDDWQMSISPDGRMFPIVPARGNHESNDNYIYHLFDTPRNNESVYYALAFGGGLVRAYTLNTEIAINGDQSTWLTEDFAANTMVRWKIAQYHKPMRPHASGKSEGNEQYVNWASAFYDNNVKLVVESDAHMVKTTWPIKPSTENDSEEGFVRDDESGTVYVGEGCWGAPLRSNDDNKSWTRNSGKFNQFKWIFVDQSKIEVRTVKLENAPFVEENPNDSPFDIPKDLMLWSPSNGKVATIYHEDVTPPTISLNAPVAGTITAVGEVVTLEATSADSDGSISKVSFYANDELIGEVDSSPYDLQYMLAETRSFSFYAVATDNEGNTATSAEVVVSAGNSNFLDACESLEGWQSDQELQLSNSHMQGSSSIEFNGVENVEFSKVFATPYNSQANPAYARLEFRYYVSAASLMGDNNQVELGSGGSADNDEYNWTLGGLSDGWNFISLKISEAKSSGSPNLEAINWFRIYNFKEGAVTTRIDGIQIVDPSSGYVVSEFSDLDDGSLFHFSIMSDNDGNSPYNASTGKREVSMQRLNAWVQSAEFVIGAGDHVSSPIADDSFLDFVKNDPYWRVKFYPNIAGGENQAFGEGENDWGSGWELLNHVDNFWDRPNVEVQPNKVDYYAAFQKSGFTVHLIQLHFSDGQDAEESLKEESRQFMEHKLEELAATKTNKDIIVVVAHSVSGDFVKDANFTDHRKDLLLSTADICVSASSHAFQRYTSYNEAYPNGAVHYNSGTATNSGATHGYMEFHVLDNPPRVFIQYINIEDYSTRNLQTDYVDGVGDPTLALVKELGGPSYNVDWRKVNLTTDLCPNDPDKLIPGSCGCGVPEGTCTPLSLTVKNGSGDGDYVHDAAVEIIADPAQEGAIFDFWGTAAGFPTFEEINSSTTRLVLGTEGALVVANYRLRINDASFVEQSVPDTIYSGYPIEVVVRMQNNGELTWKPGEYKLAVVHEGEEVWGINEVELSEAVELGEEVSFIFDIEGPEEPGEYVMQWQMKDGEGKSFGTMTEAVNLRVEELVLGTLADKGKGLSVYPNPAVRGTVTVDFGYALSEKLEVRIISLAGSIQKETTINPAGSSFVEVGLDEIRPGMYLLEVKHDNIIHSHSLIIQ